MISPLAPFAKAEIFTLLATVAPVLTVIPDAAYVLLSKFKVIDESVKAVNELCAVFNPAIPVFSSVTKSPEMNGLP